MLYNVYNGKFEIYSPLYEVGSVATDCISGSQFPAVTGIISAPPCTDSLRNQGAS